MAVVVVALEEALAVALEVALEAALEAASEAALEVELEAALEVVMVATLAVTSRRHPATTAHPASLAPTKEPNTPRTHHEHYYEPRELITITDTHSAQAAD